MKNFRARAKSLAKRIRRLYFRILLPFENQESKGLGVKADDTDEALRQILGDDFVNRMNYQFPKTDD